MNGYGELIFNDGKVYLGNHFDSKIEGFGIFIDTKKDKAFVGYWKNCQRNGIGFFVEGKSKEKIYCLFEKDIFVKYLKNEKEAMPLMKNNELNRSLAKVKYSDIISYTEQYKSYFIQKENKE